ncbi:septation protein SepH [Streptosporangium sp. NPDC000239]|uniref:septation protein SepH n=1 Tax=Streptosporangium sp. NPDC000239 TaxID=3154248 RepID=UPI00331ECB3D
MQELRLVAVSEDGTYLVLATAGRGTRFTLPVDDRLRAAVRGNFSRLGQYEIEVESPLRPKEIQARIRAGETAEEIAATAGIPVERVRWFEGPVLQEREYMAQQAQRCAVRLPGDSAPGPTLGELVAERLTRRGVPADEIDWDSAKRDDNLWRIKLGFVWNGHSRRAEWIFDPRRRHITPHDDEAMRLSSGDQAEPAEDSTVTPFVPRVAKLAPVPPLAPEPLGQPPVSFPSVLRQEQSSPDDSPQPPEAPAPQERSAPAAYTQPPMPPLPPGYDPPRPTVPPLRAPDSMAPFEQPIRTPEAAPVARMRPQESPVLVTPRPLATREQVMESEPAAPEVPEVTETTEVATPAESSPEVQETTETTGSTGSAETGVPAEPAEEEAAAVPAARLSLDERARKETAASPDPVVERAAEQAPEKVPEQVAEKVTEKPAEKVPEKVAEKPVEPPKPAPARPAKRARGRRASVPTWDEIMFGARRQD